MDKASPRLISEEQLQAFVNAAIVYTPLQQKIEAAVDFDTVAHIAKEVRFHVVKANMTDAKRMLFRT